MSNTCGRASTTRQTAQATGPPCNTEYFTVVEDRPQVRENVTYVREHKPVEKEFIVETHATGHEREVAQGSPQTEIVDSKSRVVQTTGGNPCQGAEHLKLVPEPKGCP
jgi:hypothetical protein